MFQDLTISEAPLPHVSPWPLKHGIAWPVIVFFFLLCLFYFSFLVCYVLLCFVEFVLRSSGATCNLYDLYELLLHVVHVFALESSGSIL